MYCCLKKKIYNYSSGEALPEKTIDHLWNESPVPAICKIVFVNIPQQESQETICIFTYALQLN